MQTTNHVLMVRPQRFAYNEETATNNAFQVKSESEEAARRIEQQAVREFDDYVALGSEAKCREAGKIAVEGKDYVVQDGDIMHFRFNV